MASISVIVPALNEREQLPANLEALTRDSAFSELIVVDGGSTDGTQDLVLAQERVQLLSGERGRGRQMNAGAAEAKGDWLLFHHADSLLPADAGAAIAALPDEVCWGGFLHRFSHGNWKLSFISALHNFRCRRTGVIYGDQSMFVRRDFFWSLGGFAEEGIEDLLFSDVALERAPSQLLDLEVTTDSRKFRQLGEFRALAHVLSIIVRYQRERRIGNERFFENYR
ncbi:MAG: TIGR04283 family arsenosugar biosynthesis glycosyltransferase [Pseudomonadota bacterium]